MANASGLTVRQHERQGIEVPVEFVIAPGHVAQVRFSNSSSAAGPGIIRGMASDISSGGIGFQCPHFLPRMCEGLVRVLQPMGVDAHGTPNFEPVFEQSAKVRRVIMSGREPMYAIGLAFIGADAEVEARIAALLNRLQIGATDA